MELIDLLCSSGPAWAHGLCAKGVAVSFLPLELLSSDTATMKENLDEVARVASELQFHESLR